MTARGIVAQLFAGQPEIEGRLLPAYAACWGALAGLGEASYRTLRQLILHQPAGGYYIDVIWMAPLAGALAAVLALSPVALLARATGVRVGSFKVTAILAFAAVYGILRLDGIPLNRPGAILLAAGLSAAVARGVETHVRDVRGLLLRLRSGFLAGTCALLLFALAQRPWMREHIANWGKPTADAGRPNVLMIILDTVRSANLSLYGYHRPTTPQIDRWAAQGTVFERAMSAAPWTLPGHATLFTGRYHYELATGPGRPLDDRHPTLASVLAEHGYATAGFAANLEYTTEMSGLQRGFDRYEAIPIDLNQLASSAWLAEILVLPLRAWSGTWYLQKSAETVRSDLQEWLDGRGDRPFFAFLNFFDAHDPYVSPSAYADLFGPPAEEGWESVFGSWRTDPQHSYGPSDLEPWVNQYDAAIAYIDSQIGLIRADLESRGLLDSTLVIITSDHGEMWGEHGQIGHAQGLYQPVLHVPLVFILPNRVPSARVEELVSLRDVPATILDLVGLGADAGVPGTSLTSTARDAAGPARSVALAEADAFGFGPRWAPASRGDMRTLFIGTMQYIRNGDGVEELYDFVRDPSELRDLAGEQTSEPALTRFRAALAAHR